MTSPREAIERIRAWRRRVDGAQSPYPHRDDVDTLLAENDSLAAALAASDATLVAMRESIWAWLEEGRANRDELRAIVASPSHASLARIRTAARVEARAEFVAWLRAEAETQRDMDEVAGGAVHDIARRVIIDLARSLADEAERTR